MVLYTTTKPFFNNFKHHGSINLLDELTSEVIQINGMDMYYLPRRRSEAFDGVYYEDPQSTFDTAYQIPILIKTAEGFMGSEAMMTHFGIESRLQMILTISRRQWEMNIRPLEEELRRPREGDLIHLTEFDRRTYEIKFVDEHPYFYQHGHLPMWDLTVELFEYGNEIIDTGIEEVDCLQDTSSINAYDWALLAEGYDTITGDPYNGDVFLTEDDSIIMLERWITLQSSLGLIDSNDEISDAIHPINPEHNPESNTILDWTEDNPWDENEPW